MDVLAGKLLAWENTGRQAVNCRRVQNNNNNDTSTYKMMRKLGFMGCSELVNLALCACTRKSLIHADCRTIKWFWSGLVQLAIIHDRVELWFWMTAWLLGQ